MSEILTEPVTGPSAWTSAELAADDGWIYPLGAAEIAELEAAAGVVRENGLKLYEFGAGDFPLPTLGATIADIAEQLENGRGCALIRGLDASKYDDETLRIIYWGLGAHLGDPVTQNDRGHLISQVTDSDRDYQSNNIRGYTTNARIAPHCDPTDTVGLLCAHPAKKGGESEIASAMTIHNEILATHPEYLEPLAAGFHFDLRGEGSTGGPDEVTFNRVPVFSYFDEKLSCRFNRRTIEDGQRKYGEPLEGLALEAVEAVAELAMRDGIRFDMAFQRGDIQFLNNHLILHARAGFEDHPEPERHRNLLRLWINMRDSRKLAPEFANRLNTGPRGGIHVKPKPEAIAPK
jgi:hypothetical protein